MKRNHRHWHRVAWMLLPPVLAASLAAALILKQPIPPAAAVVPALANVAVEGR